MSKEIGIYTETMAKVYAAQGHWGKAAEIYRHLLTGAPARKDLPMRWLRLKIRYLKIQVRTLNSSCLYFENGSNFCSDVKSYKS